MEPFPNAMDVGGPQSLFNYCHSKARMVVVEGAVGRLKGGYCYELLACLSDVVQKELISDIRSSPFIGLGLDESTDHSLERHLVLIVSSVYRSPARYFARVACCTAYLQGGRSLMLVSVVTSVKAVLAHYKVSVRKPSERHERREWHADKGQPTSLFCHFRPAFVSAHPSSSVD